MGDPADAREEGVLPFLVSDGDDPDDEGKGIFGRRAESLSVRGISVATLRANLRTTVAGLHAVFDEVAQDAGTLPLTQVQVQFEVTATGGITLVGSAQVASRSAITLTFGG